MEILGNLRFILVKQSQTPITDKWGLDGRIKECTWMALSGTLEFSGRRPCVHKDRIK